MEKFSPALSEQFAKLLPALAGKKIVIVGHARPDGDCIGSQVALARVLRTLGHEVICVNPDNVPRRLQFLVKDLVFMRPDAVPAGDYTVIYSDCADQDRAGEKAKVRFPHPFVSFDHHISNSRYAEHNFVDVASAATCEILAGVFLDNQCPIDAPAAQALFAGMTHCPKQHYLRSSHRTAVVFHVRHFGWHLLIFRFGRVFRKRICKQFLRSLGRATNLDSLETTAFPVRHLDGAAKLQSTAFRRPNRRQ